MLLGYARVSKGDDQTYQAQARALKVAWCKRIFEEVASGGRWDRPELHRLLDQLRGGDSIVVRKLDRLSRSLKDVLHLVERIAKAGAGFRSLTELPIRLGEPFSSGCAVKRAGGRGSDRSGPLIDWTGQMAGFWQGRFDDLQDLLKRMDQ